jgi:hypothetical protein
MRLKNYTNIPSDKIRDLIRAVRPSGISNFDVRVSNTPRGVRGSAYTKGSGYHDRACPFIVVSVAKTDRLVRHYHHGEGGYLPIYWGNRLEALLVVLAHELRHLWQAAGKGKRRGMVYGSRGRMSERDADAYALQMLRRFRRGEI